MGPVSRIAKEFCQNFDTKPREFFELVMPPVDVVQDSSDLIITIDLPGFAKNEINITIAENILRIYARRQDKQVYNHSHNVYCSRPVTIDKKIALPFSAKNYREGKNIGKASYLDGVVRLTIPLKNKIVWTE